MNIERLETFYESGDVCRLHTVATVNEHTIASHVYGAQIVAVELCMAAAMPDAVGPVLFTLLYHDAPEVDTGDVPAPVKRSSRDIDAALDIMEIAFYKEHGLVMPMLTDTQRWIVKAADTLDLCFNALRERRLGNKSRRIAVVFRNAMRYLDELTHVAGVPELVLYLRKEWDHA